jgi:hypothetical protein
MQIRGQRSREGSPTASIGRDFHWQSLLDLDLPWLDRYVSRLSGLFSFSWAQISGASGVHDQFLQRNIESFTLTLDFDPGVESVPTYLSRSDRKLNSGSTHREESSGKSAVAAAAALTLSVLQLQSRLHEELHHSLFYYLLMGHFEFVVCCKIFPFFTCLFLTRKNNTFSR